MRAPLRLHFPFLLATTLVLSPVFLVYAQEEGLGHDASDLGNPVETVSNISNQMFDPINGTNFSVSNLDLERNFALDQNEIDATKPVPALPIGATYARTSEKPGVPANQSSAPFGKTSPVPKTHGLLNLQRIEETIESPGNAAMDINGALRYAIDGQPRSSRASVNAAAAQDKAISLQEVLSLGEKLRNRKINPTQDDVPELAALISQYIAFTRKAIKEQGIEQERLQDLANLETESRKEKATYEYFNYVGLYLAILMTPQDHNRRYIAAMDSPFVHLLVHKDAWRTYAQFKEFAADYARTQKAARTPGEGKYFSLSNLAETFPEAIVIPHPIPSRDDIPSIEEMNALFGSGVYVLGLIGSRTIVDGYPLEPLSFFQHDNGHAGIQYRRIRVKPEAVQRVRQEYLIYRNALRGERRKAFEVAYFMITHEYPSKLIEALNGLPLLPSDLKEFHDRLSSDKDLGGILPDAIRNDKSQLPAFINLMKEELNSFFSSIGYPAAPAEKSKPKG